MADPSSDVAKLQGHLDLLRNEHRKLLARNSELERAVSAGGSAPNSFATQLVKAAADLFDKSLYSDILVVADDKKIHAHRFVLAARGKWTAEPLADAEVIEFTTSYPVARALLRFAYTDTVEDNEDVHFLISLLRSSKGMQLPDLAVRLEPYVISKLGTRTCVPALVAAHEVNAVSLKKVDTGTVFRHQHLLSYPSLHLKSYRVAGRSWIPASWRE